MIFVDMYALGHCRPLPTVNVRSGSNPDIERRSFNVRSWG